MQFTENFRKIFIPPHRNEPVMDGLRGLSIICIILFHCFLSPFNALRDEPERLYAFLNNVPYYLHWMLGLDKAVDVFFMVSGFLLASALFREHSTASRIDISVFYQKRMIRIYPVFLLALVVYLLLREGRHSEYLLFNVLFLDNILPSVKSIVGVGWSLCIEMQFYLLLPFIILATVKIHRKFLFLVALFCSSILVRYGIVYSNPNLFSVPILDVLRSQVDGTHYLTSLYWPTYSRYGSLLAGVMLACIHSYYHHYVSEFYVRHRSFVHIVVIMSVFFLFLSLYYPNYVSVTPERFSVQLNYFVMVAHRHIFIVSLTVILIFSTIVSGGSLSETIRKLLSLRIWYPFSRLVFPLYLFHLPVVIFTTFTFYGTNQLNTVEFFLLTDIAVIFLTSICATFLLATAIHLLLEQPCINYGYAWVMNRKFAKRGDAASMEKQLQ